MNFVLNKETIAWLIGGAGTLGGMVIGFFLGKGKAKGKLDIPKGSDLDRDCVLVYADLIQRMQSDPNVPDVVKDNIATGKINEETFRELVNQEIVNAPPEQKNLMAVRTLLSLLSDEETMYNKAVEMISKGCKSARIGGE